MRIRRGDLLRSVGRRPWFARVGRAAVPFDRFLQRRSGGRISLIGTKSLPQLLLTTTGRKTGQLREVPLLYAEHPEGFLVIGSNWGQSDHPAWSDNLLAHPAATVLVADRVVPVVAKLIEGADREPLYRSLLEVWPAYDSYAERSGRDLRVFLLAGSQGSDVRLRNRRFGG
jgi:deazaflavin-dependent oxidoreductase (nitroreductase family)